MRGRDYNTGLRGVLFEARHYERMGAAIWLYGWLVLRQTRQQGGVGWVLGGSPVTYREIEEETGFNCRTLERWMQTLRRQGYIETEAAPAGLVIRILKAKKFPQASRKSADSLRRSADSCPQFRGRNSQNSLSFEKVADRIGSSSVGEPRESDLRDIHKNFHRNSVQNAPCLGGNQEMEALQFQNGTEIRQAQKPHLQSQLLRAERDEAVRRELAVGSGPEVSRP